MNTSVYSNDVHSFLAFKIFKRSRDFYHKTVYFSRSFSSSYPNELHKGNIRNHKKGWIYIHTDPLWIPKTPHWVPETSTEFQWPPWSPHLSPITCHWVLMTSHWATRTPTESNGAPMTPCQPPVFSTEPLRAWLSPTDPYKASVRPIDVHWAQMISHLTSAPLNSIEPQ